VENRPPHKLRTSTLHLPGKWLLFQIGGHSAARPQELITYTPMRADT
jgi:hypothetical protein